MVQRATTKVSKLLVITEAVQFVADAEARGARVVGIGLRRSWFGDWYRIETEEPER